MDEDRTARLPAPGSFEPETTKTTLETRTVERADPVAEQREKSAYELGYLEGYAKAIEDAQAIVDGAK